MIEARDKSGKLLTIGYQNRFRDDTTTLHASCEAGELGEIYFAKAHALRRRAVPTWGVFPNKALQGGWPEQQKLINFTVFLTILEARSPRERCQLGCLLSLRVCSWPPSASVLTRLFLVQVYSLTTSCYKDATSQAKVGSAICLTFTFITSFKAQSP